MAAVRARVDIDERRLNDHVRTVEHRVMRSWQRQTATQARVDVPVRTGHLGRSIGEGRIGFTGPRTVRGSVHATAEYALPVHEGRGPRVIRPVRAKALRFEVGGRVVFARIVRQGPMKGRPFLRNAGMRVGARIAAQH